VFATTLGRVLDRPAVVPVPASALRLVFGEMADVALLGSIRVLPTRLQESGYAFRYPELEDALRFLLGRPAPAVT
jgi:NAD dependent epimerase/dehydratase family enzyme